MDVQLSDKQTLKIMGKRSKMVLYPDLKSYRTLEELFGNKNKILLLYINRMHDNNISGHWTILLKKDNYCEYFDSYGNFIDFSLTLYKKKWRQASEQDKKYLSDLLYEWSSDPKNEIHYNEKQYQAYGNNINTCGRFVALRAYFFPQVSLEKFQSIFDRMKKKKYDIDKAIVLMTDTLNGKKIK